MKGDISAACLKDKCDLYIPTNMHSPQAEGNFCDESGHAVKPRVIEDYNTHMGYVDKSDRMVNSYGIARRTWKWTKKLFSTSQICAYTTPSWYTKPVEVR